VGYAYQTLQDNYPNEFRRDTNDATRSLGSSVFARFEYNSLNRKQYSDEGLYVFIGARYNDMRERYRAGGDLADSYRARHQWLQFRARVQNYFRIHESFSIGISFEGAYSLLEPYGNEFSTRLSSPRFTPTVESQSLYQQQFYSKAFAAGGVQFSVKLYKNLYFRTELYAFQSFQRTFLGSDGRVSHALALDRFSTAGSVGFVYHTPFGPTGIFANYYQVNPNPVRLFVHLGYLIFRRHAWD
jgi:NTE family protein